MHCDTNIYTHLLHKNWVQRDESEISEFYAPFTDYGNI